MHCDDQIENLRGAYEAATGPPHSERARYAAWLSVALCERGWLREASTLAERAWRHAEDTQRGSEGMPTAESIEAFEEAAASLFAVDALIVGAAGLKHALDALVTVRERGMERLEEYNRQAVLPVEGPSGSVDPELVQAGEPSATIALLEGRPGDTIRILDRTLGMIPEEQQGGVRHVALRLLRLEAAALVPAPWSEDRELTSLQTLAEDHDVRWCACHLARIRAHLAVRDGDPAAGLVELNEALPVAASWGLGRQWLEIMTQRVALLVELGEYAEARLAAGMLLRGEEGGRLDWWHGSGDAPAALEEGHRRAILEAGPLLRAEGEGAAVLGRAMDRIDSLPPRRLLPRRRRVGLDANESFSREASHERALRVLRAREEDGTPLVLYLRTFNIELSHASSPFGPELLENQLLDSLPESVNALTIQDHGTDVRYDAGSAATIRRRVPALLLDEDHWQEIAEALVLQADLIVSECPMLSPGVRFELERAYRLARWDSTVLVLPPPESYFKTLDNDPLVQMFPLCVWADDLHRSPLTDTAIVRPLAKRLEAMAALSPSQLRDLTDVEARARFEPVDLSALAGELAEEAQLRQVRAGDDPHAHFYTFWMLFRASALQSELLSRGLASPELLFSFARNQLELSTAMTLNEERDGKVWIQGDLDSGRKLATSARSIFRGLDDNLSRLFAEHAETRVQEYRQLARVIAESPERFVIEPVYGPLVLAGASLKPGTSP